MKTVYFDTQVYNWLAKNAHEIGRVKIVNKADKLKIANPTATFGAVIYYPFIEEHTNVQNRLRASKVDSVVFASGAEDSIQSAVRMLLSALRVPMR